MCWNDTRPRMCHHQYYLANNCTTDNVEIDTKWICSIFFASLTLTWPWCDLEMTLVLCTSRSKAQLLPNLICAHKLRSCWLLQTNLTLQNILIFFQPPSSGIQRWECKCAQEFNGKRVDLPFQAWIHHCHLINYKPWIAVAILDL